MLRVPWLAAVLGVAGLQPDDADGGASAAVLGDADIAVDILVVRAITVKGDELARA